MVPIMERLGRFLRGKALLRWTSDAAQALELAIDLNHRFALDVQGVTVDMYSQSLSRNTGDIRPYGDARCILENVYRRSSRGFGGFGIV